MGLIEHIPVASMIVPFSDKVVLPNVQCDRCTLAWRWDALEEPSVFVNCIDISIIGNEDTPPQPAPQPGPTLPPMPDDQPVYNPYMVLSLQDKGKCLDLMGGDKSNGNPIGIWDCNGEENQRWWFKDDKIMLASDNSKCIDVPVDEYSEMPLAGAQLQLWDCNGLSNQQFGYDRSAGTIYLASSGDASLCLDIGADAEDGQRAQIWDCNNDYLQQQFYVPPPFGTFTINTGVDQWKCLDVPGQNAINGARLQVWDCNGILGQQWLFDEEDNKVRYMDDPTKCVDVPGGSVTEGQMLWLWDCNDAAGQVMGYDADMGTIYFSNSKDASMCWNLISGDTSNGNAIAVGECDGGSNQIWGMGTQHTAAVKSSQTRNEEVFA